jgi:hypothetical protein
MRNLLARLVELQQRLEEIKKEVAEKWSEYRTVKEKIKGKLNHGKHIIHPLGPVRPVQLRAGPVSPGSPEPVLLPLPAETAPFLDGDGDYLSPGTSAEGVSLHSEQQHARRDETEAY